jgi:hypothetical protein
VVCLRSQTNWSTSRHPDTAFDHQFLPSNVGDFSPDCLLRNYGFKRFYIFISVPLE